MPSGRCLRLRRPAQAVRGAGPCARSSTAATTIAVEIVEPKEGQKGFAVRPTRWVIERSFGWIARCRRLARDYEASPSSALVFFVLAAAMILVRRMARALWNRVL